MNCIRVMLYSGDCLITINAELVMDNFSVRDISILVIFHWTNRMAMGSWSRVTRNITEESLEMENITARGESLASSINLKVILRMVSVEEASWGRVSFNIKDSLRITCSKGTDIFNSPAAAVITVHSGKENTTEGVFYLSKIRISTRADSKKGNITEKVNLHGRME